jgi:transcription elongation factor Elf1
MPNVPAWVSNGVVVSDSNGQVQYRFRCPHCGFVEVNSLSSIYVAPNIGARSSYGTRGCSKCYKTSPTQAGR